MKLFTKLRNIVSFFKFLRSRKSGYHQEGEKWTWKYFHGGSLEVKYLEIESIDHDSFNVISENYGKDEAHVFFKSTVISKATPSSFKIIKDAYSQDEAHVFLENKIIINADPKTFQVLGFPYSKDEFHVFYGTLPLHIDKEEVNGFKVTKKASTTISILGSHFITLHPAYKELPLLETEYIIVGDSGAGKTNTKKFMGFEEIK